MKVPVKLPSLLSHCTGGAGEVVIEADTLSGVFESLVTEYPLLKTHLFDSRGKRREHVLFFYNEENVDWLDSMQLPVKEHDRITILQAVSGG